MRGHPRLDLIFQVQPYKDELRQGFLMDRRTLVSMMAAGAASPLLQRAAAAQPAPKARNIVLVHGLFADGSCRSEVIARLQPKGLKVTSSVG